MDPRRQSHNSAEVIPPLADLFNRVDSLTKGVGMLGQTCILCRVFGVIAIVGLLNLGIVGLLQVNYLERFLAEAPMITRILYVLMGLAGLASLIKMFTICPGCKKV